MITSKSPIFISGKSTEINLNFLSNINNNVEELFKKRLKNPNGDIIRNKMFAMYNLCKQNITQISNVPSADISNLINTIINFFYSNGDIASLKNNFSNVSENALNNLEIRCQEILKRVLNTENCLVLFDANPENYSDINFYFDTLNNKYDLNPDPLEYTWSNGFIKFAKPNNVCVNIIISLEYLKRLLKTNYKELIEPETEDALNNNSSTDLLALDNKIKFDFNKICSDFWKDFVKNCILSLYVDRYREHIYSQIYLLINLLEEKRNSRFAISNDLQSTSDFFQNHLNDFIKMKMDDSSIKNDRLNRPSLKEIYTFLSQETHINAVNPIDLYKTLFVPTVNEIITLSAKLGFEKSEDSINDTIFNYSNINSLNRNYSIRNTNSVVSMILLKRLIPIVFFTELFINNNFKFNSVQTLLTKIKTQVDKLQYVALEHMHLKHLNKIIKEIANYCDIISKNTNILINDSVVIKQCFVKACWDLEKPIEKEEENTESDSISENQNEELI